MEAVDLGSQVPRHRQRPRQGRRGAKLDEGGITERGIRDASYAIEVGRALGNIELKLFSTTAANDADRPKAA